MKLTEPEWIIMNALWDGHPAKARDVAERLPEGIGWAYTTVKTMLDRLVEKNAVKKSKQGHTGLYEPLLSRRQARSTAVRMMLNQAFDLAFSQCLVAKPVLRQAVRLPNPLKSGSGLEVCMCHGKFLFLDNSTPRRFHVSRWARSELQEKSAAVFVECDRD